jgi:hypothetical protein
MHTNQGTRTPTHTLETLEAREKNPRWQLAQFIQYEHTIVRILQKSSHKEVYVLVTATEI